MNRVPEPELMLDPGQAKAYADADFSDANRRFVKLLLETFPGESFQGTVLDLGCGPGDILFMLAEGLPAAKLFGLDGSRAMLAHGEGRLERHPELKHRLQFIEGLIPGGTLPLRRYDLITSNSLLHHVHDPLRFWKFVKKLGGPGTRVFVMDLFRPPNCEEAWKIVNQWSPKEPEVLRRDFFHSLCAAFEPEEIREQLAASGLSRFQVKKVSDRHLTISGTR